MSRSASSVLVPLPDALALPLAGDARHAFDVDRPGKDSYVHREAGAREAIVSSARRWVQIHEVGDDAEATLPFLLRRLTAVDLALVEGFKREAHPKLEVFRAANGRPPLHPEDPRIVAVASDRACPEAAVPVVGLDEIGLIADVVPTRAEPLAAVLPKLESVRHDGPAHG